MALCFYFSAQLHSFLSMIQVIFFFFWLLYLGINTCSVSIRVHGGVVRCISLVVYQQQYCYSIWWKLLELPLSEPPGVHLVNRQDDSLLPGGKVGFPCVPAWVPPPMAHLRLRDPSHSRRPCSLKGPWTCYLPQPRLPECQTHFSFFFCVPFLRPSPSQDRCCIQIIGLHSVRPGCQCSFWIEISSLVPRFPSDLPFRAPPLPLSTSPPRSRWVIIMTLASQYNDMTSMVHYLQWVSWPGALSIDHSSLLCCLGDLWIQPARHGTHSKWQPQGAFIPPAEFNHFSLSSFLPLCWVIQSLMREGR